jgi:thymidylate synthase
MNHLKVYCIVAINPNLKTSNGDYIISIDHKIPWNLTKDGDFEYFQSKTQNVALIGGRNTWNEILKLNKEDFFKNREAICVSSVYTDIHDNEILYWDNPIYKNLTFVKTFEEALQSIKRYNKVFVIGGQELYSEAIGHPLTRKVYISKILASNETEVLNENYKVFKYSELSSNYKNIKNTLTLEVFKRDYSEEEEYLNLLEELIKTPPHPNRTSITTSSLFAKSLTFSLEDNKIPLLTSKKVSFNTILHELIWFLRGEPNINYLKEHNIHIWDGNTSREFLDANGLKDYQVGETGPIYGVQWRKWGGMIDQLKNVIESIKTNPFSRRHVVSAWNPSDLNKMCLPPCHLLFIFNVELINHQKYLNCHLTMRSNDIFLGNPFNIASYSILTHMVAKLCKLKAGKFNLTMVDCHLYSSHTEQSIKQLRRRDKLFGFPSIEFNKEVDNYTEIDQFKFQDILLKNYYSWGVLKGDMVV